MELLDKTSSRNPARIIAMIPEGVYSHLVALGQEAVQVPH